MASKNIVVGCLANQLENELTEAANKLLNFASLPSTENITTILLLTENNLSTVPQPPPKSLIKPLHQIITALGAKELIRHPDMKVNISVACCICEMLRITAPKAPHNNEQIKDFFELVVMSFEKLSSVSGGFYGKMTKVLEVFSKARLPILMLDLQHDGHGLIVRLFKHFINGSECLSFYSTPIVLNMENIMRMIVEKSEKLAIELQDLLLTSIGKDNQSGSPVCWQFGQKVLMICAAKLKPTDRKSIAVFDYPEMVALICKTTPDKGCKEIIPSTTETSKMIDKIKLECPATINMMRTLRHTRATSMASQSVTEINGKRKRNNEQAQSDEHGEILVGRKIKVWRAKDEIYRPVVVKSFDCILKMHKVLFDDGLEVVIDLKMKRWMFEKLSAIPDSFLNFETQESSKEKGVTILSSQKQDNERLENENLEMSKQKQVSVISSQEALYSNVPEVENERLENENLKRSKQKQVSIVSSKEALYSNVREVENERLENENLKRSKQTKVSVVSSEEALYSNVHEVENMRLVNENLERSKQKQVSIVSSEEALYSNVREAEAGPAPKEVSSPRSGIICAQGYKVKRINAPILEDILNKHGDIASTCVFTDAAIRSSLLEGVCDIVRRIETNDVTTIISSFKEIESQVYAAEAAKIDVSWLRASLKPIHKRYEAGKKVTMLMDVKSNTTLVLRAAGTDRKERHAKLVAAQENLIAAQNQLAEAEKCEEVLKLVEKKLNDDVLESKAEKDLWVKIPVV